MVKAKTALAALAMVPLGLSGCGNDPSSGGPPQTTPPSASPSTTPAPTAPATSTPAPSKPAARTAAQLTKALLELKDLPSGFSMEPEESGEGEVTFAAKDTRCRQLVALLNADNPPGSKASAHRSFSGGQNGPYIDEQLDALGSAQATLGLLRSFRAAVDACRALTVSIPGEGRSPFEVREVSAPQAGQNPVAVRFTATGGSLEGLEITMVATGVGDVVLSMHLLEAVPDDVDGATEAAVDKAKKILGTKTGA